MAATTLITIEDYLGKTLDPDMEYIDGELKERPIVVSVHGLLQSLISIWFGQHEDEWSVRVGVEIRTRVTASRVRLPDVVVDVARPWPETLVSPPLLVIEILSPNDSYSGTEKLAKDYQSMGVPNIWLIDPETRTGRVCQGDAWKEVRRFEVEGSGIYLELDWLFGRLDRYDSQDP